MNRVHKIKQLARNSLQNLGEAATRRTIKQFIAKYHFVYFGHVDPREDEYELVRGLTASTTHSDNHYTVGTYNGHDIILVERRNTLTFPGRAASNYRWLIMQIDLKRNGLPHVFIDARHHDVVFYANAFVAQQSMQDVSSYFNNLGPTFAQKCRVFASPTQYAQVGAMLQPAIAETVAKQFSHFDYEIFDDKLLVYAKTANVTVPIMDDMLRVGVWLAENFNSVVV